MENYTIHEINQKFEELNKKGEVLDLPLAYIGKLELAEKKGGGKFLKCVVGDSTGEVSAKLWDEATSLTIFNKLEELEKKAAVADIRATTNVWNGNKDLIIENIRIKLEESVAQFLEKSKVPFLDLFNELMGLINRVENEKYKRLLLGIFDKHFEHKSAEIAEQMKRIRKDFLYSAAATGHHHNYIHGLLEHTLNVVKTALHLAELYKDIYEVDWDLLITGGILHDIGKIFEYVYEEGIGYSDEGPFIYHTVSGSMLLVELNRDLDLDLDRTDLMKLVHLITSHHGEYSERTPNQFCVEAHILSFADMADSQANKALRSVSSDSLRAIKPRR